MSSKYVSLTASSRQWLKQYMYDTYLWSTMKANIYGCTTNIDLPILNSRRYFECVEKNIQCIVKTIMLRGCLHLKISILKPTGRQE